MRVGVQMVFQAWGYEGRVTDGEIIEEEIHLGELAEALGFHALWPVEHHFFDYSFCPDNTVFLAHMAARTKRILLGTGAVILPWNDPLRVAEKISLLDHLSGGRVLFGMGRGLARREYAGFGIPMDESREGRRPLLPPGPDADPPRTVAFFHRPDVLRGDVAGLGRRGRGPGRPDGDVQPASLGRPGRVRGDVPRPVRGGARNGSRAADGV
jgi:hypothetical protein